MKRRLTFLGSVFGVSVLFMVLQKPFFMLFNRAQADGSLVLADWLAVVVHGLKLDLTVAGYVTVIPLLLVLVSLWVRLPERPLRVVLTTYFALVSLLTAAIFAVDLGLYPYWGFRIDSTILIYLADPKEAVASIDWWLGVRQILIFGSYAAILFWVYRRITVRGFGGERFAWRSAAGWSLVVLLLGGFDFLAIRGGVGTSVANVSKVYFSPRLFLNHAAINPVFSFLSSLGEQIDYAAAYPFYPEAERAARFEALRGNVAAQPPTQRVLNGGRPNVVVVILESFARTLMDAQSEGQAVMPNMQRLKNEGIWFENFFANSFRTDRGEVAILSGFPAQTQISIMKLPAKSSNLPSVARSLAREGYATSFAYGGDLNFTNQASYMYATGWQELVWQKDMHFDAPVSKWGYDDEVVCAWFADRVIALDRAGKPFLAGLLTLSSHEPFEVPYHKFEDKILNAAAFSDACVGRMIDSLKASPAWQNLLVVLVADHGYPYPRTLLYNEPLRHRIPMIWTGGAIAAPHTVESYGSQIDLCATLLGQLGLSHADYDYSKDLFAPDSLVRKFAYYTFNDGFGVVDAHGQAIWDAASGESLPGSDPELLEVGRTMLQTTYVDISRR